MTHNSDASAYSSAPGSIVSSPTEMSFGSKSAALLRELSDVSPSDDCEEEEGSWIVLDMLDDNGKLANHSSNLMALI
jgi:hypothetical protein